MGADVMELSLVEDPAVRGSALGESGADKTARVQNVTLDVLIEIHQAPTRVFRMRTEPQ